MIEETLAEKGLGPEFEDRLRFIELTVMCTELFRLGHFSRGMSAIEEAEFLYEYNNEMTDIILEHDGTLDRYDKGNIVAFFGDPVREGHAERACAAALGMQERLRARWGHGTELRLRCGLSTGKVIVGDMGSRHRADYTVVGDAVNMAGRLVQVEQRLGAAIVISQDTCQKVGGAFEVQELDRITCTGYDQPVAVFDVLGRRGAVDKESARLVKFYQKGLNAYRDKKWAEALACFEKAGAKDLGYGFSRRYATRCWLHMEVPEFEAVCRLPGQDIEEILRQVDQRDLNEALREMDAEFREVFFRQMSQRVRRFMEEELEALQLMSYSRDIIAEKYRTIVNVATQLSREGKISFAPAPRPTTK